MKIIPLGDSALVIRVRETLDDPRGTLAVVLETIETLRRANWPGVLEITPAFLGVGIFFDPAKIGAIGSEDSPNEWLTGRIEALLNHGRKIVPRPVRAPLVEIPVCYDDEFAPDLPLVAERAGLASAEVVRRHSAAEYRVHCLGFTPGFAFLSGLPAKLATPRRDTPRKEVPAGAVAIGGQQTGVYPQVSPGGWNVIGRSPIRFFDASAATPTLLRVGDRVRFRPITRTEFDSLGK
ncbi:MAG: 5-oxoprolinase subunit PxpB [Chthoniobacterales bacterium]